ncbi:MAG: hypothetical protein R3C62_14790 [Chloroflexota bacterium]
MSELDTLEDEQEVERNWQKMGLTALETEWDNPDDAIYDDWREHYFFPAAESSHNQTDLS